MSHSAIQGEDSTNMTDQLMVMMPGGESLAKDFALKLVKLAQLEFNLPEQYIKEVQENFKAIDFDTLPKGEAGCWLPEDTAKVRISQSEFGMFKYLDGDDRIVRSIVKEVCIFLHLKELQGTMIPSLVAYGVVDAEGAPGFFLLAEHCGDEIVDPRDVAAAELGEILRAVHDRGVSLGGWGFPYLLRRGSTLVVSDFTNASFEKRKDKLECEFNSLLNLCKKD